MSNSQYRIRSLSQLPGKGLAVDAIAVACIVGLVLGSASCSGGGSSSAATPASTPTPQFSLSATTFSFANTTVGTTSATLVVTVSSVGTGSRQVSSVAESDLTDFPGTNTCVAMGSLAPGSTCNISVQFKPSAAGSLTCQVTVATNAGNGTISLSGNAIAATPIQVSVSPPSATVAPSATQQFSATVSGTSNTAVTWSVNSLPGGNSTVGTISATGLYTAPATAPNPNTVTVTATSAADPTKSASAQATVTASEGLSISSLSSSSPLPLTPLYVSTSGLDTSSSAPAVTIQMSDAAGFSVTEEPTDVGSDGTVVAAVPLYADPTSGQIGPGTLSLVLTQSSQSTQPTTLSVQDLRPLSTYGTQLGDISRAVLNLDTLLIGRLINQLQAFQSVPGNSVDTSQAQATLNTLLTAIIEARQDVDEVALDNSAVVNNGPLPDGTPVQFDQRSLDVMDRISAVFLNQTFATLVPTTSASAQATPLVAPRQFRRLAGRSQDTLILADRRLRLFLSRSGARSRVAVPQDESSQFGSLLAAMQTANNAGIIAASSTGTVSGKDLAEQASALIGGIASLGQAMEVFQVSGNVLPVNNPNFKLGAIGAVISDITLVVRCWTDVGAYIAAVVSGNQALANTVVEDVNEIPTSKILTTLGDLILAFPGLQAIDALMPRDNAESDRNAAQH